MIMVSIVWKKGSVEGAVVAAAAVLAWAFAVAASAASAPGSIIPTADLPAAVPHQEVRENEPVISFATFPEAVEAGSSFHLAIVMSVSPGAYLFWEHPGEEAPRPEIRVRAGEGIVVEAARFPRPEVVRGGPAPWYGYRDGTVLFVPITLPEDHEGGLISFDVHIQSAVGRGDTYRLFAHRERVEIPTAGAPSATDEGVRDRIARAWRQLPIPLSEWQDLSVRVDGDLLVIEGSAHGNAAVRFVPADRPGIRFGRPTATRTRDRFLVRIAVELRPDEVPEGTELVWNGLVLFGRDRSEPAVVITGRAHESPG